MQDERSLETAQRETLKGRKLANYRSYIFTYSKRHTKGIAIVVLASLFPMKIYAQIGQTITLEQIENHSPAAYDLINELLELRPPAKASPLGSPFVPLGLSVPLERTVEQINFDQVLCKSLLGKQIVFDRGDRKQLYMVQTFVQSGALARSCSVNLEKVEAEVPWYPTAFPTRQNELAKPIQTFLAQEHRPFKEVRARLNQSGELLEVRFYKKSYWPLLYKQRYLHLVYNFVFKTAILK